MDHFRAKLSFGSAEYHGEEKIDGKTVVITGASSGIGRSTAENLAKRGGRIIMACRNLEKCEEVRKQILEMTGNNKVFCKQLDLASFASVRKFADDFISSEDKLDVLINNAGVMGLKQRQVSSDGIEMHHAVNYFGPFLLTHLLLDKLKSSSPSRIINVVSPVYRRSYINFNDINLEKDYTHSKAYGRSKVALVSFNLKLAEILDGTGVSTYAVNPGIVDTDLKRHLMDSVYRRTMGKINSYFMKSPEAGCQTVLYCALSPDLADESGFMYRECSKDENLGFVNRRQPRERLYAVSQVWTGLKEKPQSAKQQESSNEETSITVSTESLAEVPA